jgi:acetyltransferase
MEPSIVHDLDKIFKPKRIALIGVTPNPQSVGGKVLSNLVGSGFEGVVYPVNPSFEAVLGIQCYPDLKSLPKKPDLAVICSPATQVPIIVQQCGDAGILGIIIITAGFKETGAEGKALEEQIKSIKQKFEGMRILGPNCLGIIVPGANLNVSFATGIPKDGNIAFISQSGALCSSVLDWAIEEKVGFSYFVSIGNTMDVDFGDLIDYFGEDEKTKSIILYIESLSQARKFMSAARAFARTKPIIAYKAGRFPESAEAAASHTGAMASEDAVFEAAFKRVGMARVMNIGEIFDCADLIGRKKIPLGPRLGIVTNAGGPGVMATDSLIAANGALAKLSDETMVQLNENLPSAWSHGNPVDVLGDARSKRIAKAIEILIKDNGVDAVLVILTPQAMTNPTTAAKAVGQLAATTSKPILAAWLGGHSMREGIQILNESGVASYSTPEQAVRAFMTLVEYSRNLESLYETPKDIPVQFPLDRKKIRFQFDSVFASKGSILSEDVSKTLLEAYGIPSTRPRPAKSAEEAVRIGKEIGYPVVLKIFSSEITHKTDVGGVLLNLKDDSMVKDAFKKITTTARSKMPDARIDGVTVQPMIDLKDGIEMILGTKKDPVFGTVMMVGSGGVTAELFGDRIINFPPLSERLAMKMLESLKIMPLLKGYRGKPPVNTDKLIEILIRLSYLVADYPEIKELDINPLLVTPTDVIALDARVILDREVIEKPIKKYSHLALRPYPEEYVHEMQVSNTQLTLRPIKPEDEPLWFDLLEGCSKESLYTRFRAFINWKTHQVASRFCFIDYEREIAIVAEVIEKGKRKLLGVGRLIVEPDFKSVEYAVLVTDKWQNKGLGSILTNYCIDIAKEWGMKKIIAHTNSDNPRMVSVFKKLGFEIFPDEDGSSIDVVKDL